MPLAKGQTKDRMKDRKMKDSEAKTGAQQRLRPYWQALPDILKYQLATKSLMSIWIFILGTITNRLLASAGRVAMTSGDFKFLISTPEGILIILVGLVSLFLCVALDLNAKIAISRNFLIEGRASIKQGIHDAFIALKKLISLRGLSIVVYIALVSPLIGLGLSISMTKGLYIPKFIAEFIESSPVYMVLAYLAGFLFLSVGIANLFILHGIVLEGLSAKEAGKQSKALMREHWKDYLKQNVLFILVMAVLVAGAALIFFMLPLAVIEHISLPAAPERALTILFFITGVLMSVGVDLLVTPMYIMKMTQLFYSYKNGEAASYRSRDKRKHPHAALEVAIFCVIVAAMVTALYTGFDKFFPQTSSVEIIAHRGGGAAAPENTLAGFRAAWKAGADGSETDIQRTKDGHYVLNHDGTFKRVAGVDRKAQEMTLKEVRKMSVGGEPVPTLEETLDFCKGKLILYLELKGKTADRKMADDVVRMIREYGMEKDCVVVSLKYDLIDYIEKKDPEIRTGFLLFATYGDTAMLNCDVIGLEEESAGTSSIAAIHKQERKAIVWTVNEEDDQRIFLCSDADSIITDNVAQAAKIKASLKDRSDYRRMLDRIRGVLD